VIDERRAELEHELRTPLAVIAGYAELLAIRDDEDTRRAAAEQILAATRRLEASLDDLLGLGAASSPDANGHLSTVRPAGPSVRPARIVVIDDDIFIRRLLRLTLSTDAFEIAEASDGESALALANAQTPDLVLLDWRMPGLQGDEVLKRLKAAHPELPVLVLTAEPKRRGAASRLGADGFLAKPFSPLELLETIERLLADRSD
jgi:CheY-like chemotaxis protein